MYPCIIPTHPTHPSAKTTHLLLLSMALLKDGFSVMPSSLQLFRRGAGPLWSSRLQLGTRPHFMGCNTLSPKLYLLVSPPANPSGASWMWGCSLEINTGLHGKKGGGGGGGEWWKVVILDNSLSNSVRKDHNTVPLALPQLRSFEGCGTSIPRPW